MTTYGEKAIVAALLTLAHAIRDAGWIVRRGGEADPDKTADIYNKYWIGLKENDAKET
jgi:hypothetical protein